MNLISNINYSIRQILKQPGFAVAVVLTLALGIGANSAIFSMINGIMLQPLPYPDGEDLVVIHNAYPKNGLDTPACPSPTTSIAATAPIRSSRPRCSHGPG